MVVFALYFVIGGSLYSIMSMSLPGCEMWREHGGGPILGDKCTQANESDLWSFPQGDIDRSLQRRTLPLLEDDVELTWRELDTCCGEIGLVLGLVDRRERCADRRT